LLKERVARLESERKEKERVMPLLQKSDHHHVEDTSIYSVEGALYEVRETMVHRRSRKRENRTIERGMSDEDMH
jgi:hypothetical protein